MQISEGLDVVFIKQGAGQSTLWKERLHYLDRYYTISVHTNVVTLSDATHIGSNMTVTLSRGGCIQYSRH
jgi:hypothetical protein